MSRFPFSLLSWSIDSTALVRFNFFYSRRWQKYLNRIWFYLEKSFAQIKVMIVCGVILRTATLSPYSSNWCRQTQKMIKWLHCPSCAWALLASLFASLDIDLTFFFWHSNITTIDCQTCDVHGSCVILCLLYYTSGVCVYMQLYCGPHFAELRYWAEQHYAWLLISTVKA